MRASTWVLYVTSPIDDWVGWTHLGGSRNKTTGNGCLAARVFGADFLDLGWEGDGSWWRTSIPNPAYPNGTDFIFAVKQDNNGTTFIASPFRLPWVETSDVQIATRRITEDPYDYTAEPTVGE